MFAELVETIGIEMRTAGDRADDPAAMPFTRFVFICEKLMPEEEQSPSLSACAKRIDRAIAAEPSLQITRIRRGREPAGAFRDK
jgi:hypothetical protein